MAGGQHTILIAESSSMRTEWALVENGVIIENAITTGLNPYFLSRREISHIIRLELPEIFFKRRWGHVYFYGAGCSNAEKTKVVESSLVAQFKTPVTVMSDLLGAARGLLIHEPGLACILGTGSNSCYYDGNDIQKNVRSLGYILGDEGSGAALGRLFLGDVMKGIAPKELADKFYEEFRVTADDIMDAVYNNANANRNLRTYSFFLSYNLDSDYVKTLIYNELNRFFVRNVLQYENCHDMPVSFVGAIATAYSEILLNVATRHAVTVQKIVRNSMPGLVTFHSKE